MDVPTDGCDVLVAGGGPAGLSAALALAHAGLGVVVADPGPAGPGSIGAPDRRTSALMLASVTMLTRLGVWERCADTAAPLERMRIIDDTGRLFRAPTLEFAAEEIGEPAFGWNVPNVDLVGALREQVAATNAIRFVDAAVAAIEAGPDDVVAVLSNGEKVSARLVAAADGRRSLCRGAAGIEVDEWSYDQAAIVLNLRHERPHDNVSTEFHRPPGPFTLVPLPGNRSSLVWVEPRRLAEALRGLDADALAREIETHSHRILGRVEVDGDVGLYPLSGLNARRYAAGRVALVGEAGHVVPPIGAQGLNLSLRDAASVAEVAAEAAARGADPGGPESCAAYDRARRVDVMSRVGAIDMMNRTLLAGFLPVQGVRALGIAALGTIGPLRRFAMREGIAPAYRLPAIMQSEPSGAPLREAGPVVGADR